MLTFHSDPQMNHPPPHAWPPYLHSTSREARNSRRITRCTVLPGHTTVRTYVRPPIQYGMACTRVLTRSTRTRTPRAHPPTLPHPPLSFHISIPLGSLTNSGFCGRNERELL